MPEGIHQLASYHIVIYNPSYQLQILFYFGVSLHEILCQKLQQNWVGVCVGCVCLSVWWFFCVWPLSFCSPDL